MGKTLVTKHLDVDRLLALKTIPPEYLPWLAYGACFLASGGGGSIEIGKKMIEKILNPVDVAELSAVPDAGTVSVVADIGSPDAMMEGKGITAPIHAYNDLASYWTPRGKTIRYLLPVEMGAVSTIIPFIVASIRTAMGISVVNADPCGRAVPMLGMTLLNSAGLPVEPVVLTSDDSTDPRANMGDHFGSFVWVKKVEDAEDCARCAISSDVYQEIAGLGCYTFDGRNINTSVQRAVIPRTVNKALALGYKMTQEYAGPKDFLDNWVKKQINTNSYLLVANGYIKSKHEKSGGFDTGTIEILDADTGTTWRICYMNESLYLEKMTAGGPELHAMGPDMICLLSANGLAFSNADIQLSPGNVRTPKSSLGTIPIGTRVSLFGVASDDRVRKESIMVNGFLTVIGKMFSVLERTDPPPKVFRPIEQLNP